jgi:hypothetical protein
MPIETICQGCGKRLRVADEHAGKMAKCPQCQIVYTVPQPTAAVALGAGTASASPLPADDRWHLRTDGGLTFGPVSRHELDRWQAEGRISHTSQILHEGDGNWAWAGQIYPQLAPLALSGPGSLALGGPNSPPAAGASPTGFDLSANPYASPTAFNSQFPGHAYREQHRGGAILALGVISFVICQLIGIAPVIMGFADLAKMKQGVMDPAGRGLTIAGLVLGCISTAFVVLYVGIIGLAMLANL